jgi:hypothetical protein
MEMLKICTKCKIEKLADLKYFRKNKLLKSGLDSWCRDCANEYRNNLRKLHPPKEWGIPESEVERFVEAKASEECIICGLPAEVIDHDHITKRIRGSLCHRCNMGLGHFRDNPELLELAAMYLRGECACGECETKWGGILSN